MVLYEEIEAIFANITEKFDAPIPIGGQCESNIFYRTEELSEADLDRCAEYVVERLEKVSTIDSPKVLLKLPGDHSCFAERLARVYRDIVPAAANLVIDDYSDGAISNGMGEKYRNQPAILVNDVITTARSTLEAHSKATLRGIPVICWATLIDRTFGPGPVPVVSAFTGAPVRVLTSIA